MTGPDLSLELLLNPGRDPGWRPEPGLEAEAATLHRALPGYAETPVHEAPGLAARAGLARVLLKDESSRLGLPAFKALGAWWASCWELSRRIGRPELATDPGALREAAAGSGIALACATEGNHGRAVARVARELGLDAHVVVPDHTIAARLEAIEAEGAHVERVHGGYDAAVARAASLAGDRRLVIADTSWPGYAEVPRRVVEGYATIFAELEARVGQRPADLVLVPIGVGSLAAAAARSLRRGTPGDLVRVVGVEPAGAACALASARAGEPVTVDGPQDSLMAGLNCATPSADAWPSVSAGFDAFCAIGDEHVLRGTRALAEDGLDRGPVAGGVAGALEALMSDPATRLALELPAEATALLILTEGVTDREAFEAAVGRPPPA